MNKRQCAVEVVENKIIANGVQSMVIEYEEDLSPVDPGQFVTLTLNRQDLLLPRPLSICRQENRWLTLVYGVVGKGTEELSRYGPGTRIQATTPLGNGYRLPERSEPQEYPTRALLIGGGLGVPPLVELSKALLKREIQVDVVLGFQEEPFLEETFHEVGANIYVATQRGTSGFRGTVIDLIQERKLSAEYYFSCGPHSMLKAVTDLCGTRNQRVQVSLEERMGCGYGACMGCACQIRKKDGQEELIINRRVCTDGPVFWGDEVVWHD
jgi:dihydroorotate dehydrogenase electron transfer subunit